jgi:hypothetical protein
MTVPDTCYYSGPWRILFSDRNFLKFPEFIGNRLKKEFSVDVMPWKPSGGYLSPLSWYRVRGRYQ